MTRKIYIAIADTFGVHIRHATSDDTRHALRLVAVQLCGDFQKDNSSFDRDRFMDHIDAIATGTKEVTS